MERNVSIVKDTQGNRIVIVHDGFCFIQFLHGS